jgi:phytanoyl-CoA hydroxylase
MTGTHPESWLDSTARARFEEQGYVILKGLLEPDVVRNARAELEGLVDRLARSLRAGGKIRRLHADEPFETRLYRLFQDRVEEAPKSFRPELHLAGLYPVFFHPVLLDIVEEYLGGEIRLYPNYTARPKLPEWEGTLVLWHQDGGYTDRGAGGGVETLRMVNVWSPLVPARVENGCMQFIPGTHRLGVVPHEQRRHYLEIRQDVLDQWGDQAIPVECDPGDVVLFHNLLFHCGLPNRSGTIRWSLDWRYQDATQPTMRTHTGHIARSRRDPESAVRSAEEWSILTFR